MMIQHRQVIAAGQTKINIFHDAYYVTLIPLFRFHYPRCLNAF